MSTYLFFKYDTYLTLCGSSVSETILTNVLKPTGLAKESHPQTYITYSLSSPVGN